MLSSPSGSASLSERFAPLRAQRVFIKIVEQQVSCRLGAFVLKDVKKIFHKNLTLSTARWCRQACSCWGTSPASASWLRGSCPQGRPSGCCRVGTRSRGSGGRSQPLNKRPLVVIWRLISAFTLNTYHWTIKSQAVIIWARQTQWKWDPCRVMWQLATSFRSLETNWQFERKSSSPDSSSWFKFPYITTEQRDAPAVWVSLKQQYLNVYDKILLLTNVAVQFPGTLGCNSARRTSWYCWGLPRKQQPCVICSRAHG